MGSQTTPDNSKSEVRDIVKKINELWVGGNAEKLGRFFHEEMVIVGPDLRKIVQGRKECVKGYMDFGDQAKVLEYNELDFVINVWGNTAAVDYGFQISYELGGRKYHDDGRDLFIFSRGGNESKWLAVWRMIVASQKTR